MENHSSNIMDQKMLDERSHFLQDLQTRILSRLKKYPEGTLRITHCRGKAFYYHRKTKDDQLGVYIKKSNTGLIKELAQKEYEKKVYKVAGQELKAITVLKKNFPDSTVEDVFSNLSGDRKNLVDPLIATDEQFIKQWKMVLYKGRDFDDDAPELYTDNGLRVRSKSEILISNTLDMLGIPYRYEYPVFLRGYGTVFPDFTVLNVKMRKELYWEHLGMMDNSDYADKAIRKIRLYEQNHIYPGKQLILTAETLSTPIDIRQVKEYAARYCL